MNSRERIRAIIAGDSADRCGFWLGKPHPDTWPIYLDYFGVATEEELRVKLGDDFRWICPQFFPDAYRHPEGREMFDVMRPKASHGQAGPFAECEDIQEILDYEWPEAKYLHFEECLAALRNAGDVYRASGFWTCFHHDTMDLFGIEAYLTKMYTHPELVHAAMDRVCAFYYEANERFFDAAGDLIDAYFLGNDFGTQLNLVCAPPQFQEFIVPRLRKFAEQGHRRGYQVIMHSCGAIHSVIDMIVDAGIDCLHPLQARAHDMNADVLAKDFKGRVAFMGGVDTQELLVSGSPEDIENEVRRLKRILGPNYIVSPSHESVLSNVPPQNIEAMAKAAHEL